MKQFVVISGSEHLRAKIVAQLNDLFDNGVDIRSYAVDTGFHATIRDALVLVTSSLILEECRSHLHPSCQVLIARRTLDFACLDKLYGLPEDSTLLVANDAQETACTVIDLLKAIGFHNHDYLAYYPGCPWENPPYDYVIVTRKSITTPPGARNIIEIGSRVLDITTIVEILKSLDMVNLDREDKINLISTKYMTKIIAMGKELQARSQAQRAANEFLVQVINSVNDGIVSYDRQGTIQLINKIASDLLNLGQHSNILHATRATHLKLNAFLRAPALDNHLFEINNTTFLLSKLADSGSGSCLLTIKNVRERINMENSLKKQLKKQGYHAKYQFHDLVFRSTVMAHLVQKAGRLAESEFNIMIYGESGTGKEIFASAIHNASRRRDGPFLAVNCSALPDELIESELFGYEEGAFTGAKKGGKVGLFELANQGTLFLDEIGDISPKIQSRLLRVLQEKEVLKIGGSQNTPVDVRVVAATNRNLSAMVKQGLFREDLYYRLKKLYIQIPPLRERRDDILPLTAHFFIQKNGLSLQLTREACDLLVQYPWPGNVRELESCVEYILAVRESDIIDRSLLAEDLLQAERTVPAVAPSTTLFILKAIGTANRGQDLIGRKKLAELSGKSRGGCTEHRIRQILDELAERGLVRMGRGKIGLRLTERGRSYLEEHTELVIGANGG